MLDCVDYKEALMRLTVLFLCALAALALPGCGIKPQKVDPPPSVKADKFPHTYPNPATDPQPERKP